MIARRVAKVPCLGYLAETIIFRFFGEQGLQGEYLFALLRPNGDAVGDGIPVHLPQGFFFQMLQIEVTVLDVLLQNYFLDQEA